MSAADDALDVARFIDRDARAATCRARHLSGASGDMLHQCSVAAAERALVERRLGVEYRDAMVNLYHREVMNTDWRYDYNVWALVAPLDARLRAMARVVRENTAPTSGVENQKREST